MAKRVARGAMGSQGDTDAGGTGRVRASEVGGGWCGQVQEISRGVVYNIVVVVFHVFGTP
jgi:hypothetical protein